MPSHTPIYTHRTSKFPAATWGAFYVVSRKQSKSAANKRNCCNKPRFLLLYSHLPWIFAAWETVTEYLWKDKAFGEQLKKIANPDVRVYRLRHGKNHGFTNA